jgi:hypothetical protein
VVDVGSCDRATRVRPWYARLAFAAALAAVGVLLVFAGLESLELILVGIAGLAVAFAGGWWFLTGWGPWRWLALGLTLAAPVVVLVFFTRQRLTWVALLLLGLWVVTVAAGRTALSGVTGPGLMPE